MWARAGASARTVAAPTASAVVANGAARQALGHPREHEAGPDDEHPDAGRRRSRRRAPERARRARPSPHRRSHSPRGDARRRRSRARRASRADCARSARSEASSSDPQPTKLTRITSAAVAGSASSACLGAEHADREYDDIEPAGCARTRARSRARACRDRRHRAGRSHRRRSPRARATRAPPASGPRSRPSRYGRDGVLAGEPADDRQPDLGAAADQQHPARSRRHSPAATSPVRSARSERQSASGSAAIADRAPLGEARVHRCQCVRAHPHVLRQVDAAACLRDELVELGRAPCRCPGRPAAGRARASSPRSGTTAARRWRDRSP